MKKILKISLCLALPSIFVASVAFAAGFKLPEQGAKAMGMSMAWTAQADDPSAIYFNPAGITQLEGKHFLLGGTLILANGSGFTGSVTTPASLIPPLGPSIPTDESGKDQTFFSPVTYFTMQTSEKIFLGIGINAPFGLARTYSPNFTIPTTTTGNIGLVTQHVSLKTIVVNPTIAVKVKDYLSLGFGIDFMHGEAELDQVLAPGTKFHLEGDGDAWSWNAGLLFTPGYNLRFGLSYRNDYNLEIAGAATAFGASTAGKTKVKAGDILNAAVAYQTDKFTVEFDYDYTKWSDFENLNIILNSSLGPIPTLIPQPKNWKDVVAYRLGFMYNFSKSCYGSLGLFYDETPVPVETLGSELPDSDRVGFSLGTGFAWKKFDIDLSYIMFDYDDRDVSSPPNQDFNGTWTNEAHLFALNVSYAF